VGENEGGEKSTDRREEIEREREKMRDERERR
jgi:hypothetical protein